MLFLKNSLNKIHYLKKLRHLLVTPEIIIRDLSSVINTKGSLITTFYTQLPL